MNESEIKDAITNDMVNALEAWFKSIAHGSRLLVGPSKDQAQAKERVRSLLREWVEGLR